MSGQNCSRCEDELDSDGKQAGWVRDIRHTARKTIFIHVCIFSSCFEPDSYFPGGFPSDPPSFWTFLWVQVGSAAERFLWGQEGAQLCSRGTKEAAQEDEEQRSDLQLLMASWNQTEPGSGSETHQLSAPLCVCCRWTQVNEWMYLNDWGMCWLLTLAKWKPLSPHAPPTTTHADKLMRTSIQVSPAGQRRDDGGGGGGACGNLEKMGRWRVQNRSFQISSDIQFRPTTETDENNKRSPGLWAAASLRYLISFIKPKETKPRGQRETDGRQNVQDAGS